MMPNECYLKLHENARVNCRNKVIDHCISVGGDVKVAPQPSRNSFVAAKVMPNERCQECAAAYERDGGCQYALRGKWFKIRMPGECYLNVNEKSGADCRKEVIDHCRSVESAVSVDALESAVSVDAVESAVSVGESVAFGGELESAVSRGQCKACALEYEEAGGCKYALKGKWFKIRMPDTCYLNVNTKSRRDCRREVIRHCKRFGITQSVLNYSMNIFAIIGFLALIYGFGTTYRTFTAKAEYDQIDDR